MKASTVIAVIAIEEPDHAVPLARALVAGGIFVLEITLRTAYGLRAITAIREQVPQAMVGVGTLLHPEQLDMARDAGARFGVSPGLSAGLIEASKKSGLPLLPGVMTPSEIMAARDAGLKQLKLFPAVAAGGVNFLNSVLGPLPDITFCPTGGVTQDNALAFLSCPNVACVGGSWLTPKKLIEAQRWEEITALALAASRLRT